MYSTHDMFVKTVIIRIKLKPMSKMRSDILLYIECLCKIYKSDNIQNYIYVYTIPWKL